ncbi:hypothetical protein [Streptomyces sp. CRN 30]|uniref:hypothetical protein n=1 Tax=Streptomyces sp. CRN 30 TaxID=3075613 RepID=UPI002A8336AA|nr:hypothetical protein [Streptomyces sp. CRN 30]
MSGGLPEDITIVRADARSLPDTDQAIDRARRQFGSLDLLFLNRGAGVPAMNFRCACALELPRTLRRLPDVLVG